MDAGVDLYWLPLGAGGHSVRLNGRVFEAVAAVVERRPRLALYHSALVVRVPGGEFVVEQAPAGWRRQERGVVTGGAVGSRWADELNARVKAYLEEGGLEVVGVTSRGQWAEQAFGMSFEQGLQTALDVGREAATLDPNVDAVWVAGGAAMALHIIPALEAEFGKPAFTNLSAEVWHGLVHTKVIDPVKDWGTLLATP